MTWNADGVRWDCERCDQVVEDWGPWCRLFALERGLCRPVVAQMYEELLENLQFEDAAALAALARKRWGTEWKWSSPPF